MKKIKITEEQYKKLMSIEEAWIDNENEEEKPVKKTDQEYDDERNEFQQKVADVSSGKNKLKEECEDEVKEDLYENVEKTFGNLEVRNLIKEGEEIHGEVKSTYGVWGKMKWDNDGTAQGFDNVFKRLTYKIQL